MEKVLKQWGMGWGLTTLPSSLKHGAFAIEMLSAEWNIDLYVLHCCIVCLGRAMESLYGHLEEEHAQPAGLHRDWLDRESARQAAWG